MGNRRYYPRKDEKMKHFKKVMALLLAMVMVLAMGTTALAADPEPTPSDPSITIVTSSVTGEASTDTTQYTWYRIFEADIAVDPTQNGSSQLNGQVAYYVDTQDKATQIQNTGLFNVVRVGETNKWYVELISEDTSAADIEAAFKAKTFDLSKFPTGSFHQDEVAGRATSGKVDPGYYYVVSTAGTNAFIQTLTAVTIDEKNTFPTVGKTVDSTDENAQIGDEISYTLTVHVPESANDIIVLTDKMTSGLTFKSIDSCKSDAEGSPDVLYHTLLTGDETTDVTLTPENVTGNNNTFRIKFDVDTVIANRGKTITIAYTAVLNNKAQAGNAEINKISLKYGSNYESVIKEVETLTYAFDFEKVDGNDKTTPLTGAIFKLTKDPAATSETTTGWIELVEIEPGKTYRIRMNEDTAPPVTEIKTNGNQIAVIGVDSDVTYYLVETKAPTGYNKLNHHVEIKATEKVFANIKIENSKGSELPSTGGIGTTIFYVVGAVLVIGAGVLLVSRRRMR